MTKELPTGNDLTAEINRRLRRAGGKNLLPETEPTQPVSDEKPNSVTLKTIYEKTLKEQPGGGVARFGKEIMLDQYEQEQLAKLVALAKEQLAQSLAREPLWQKFSALMEARGKAANKFVTMQNEADFIIEDPAATDITKDVTKRNGLPDMPSLRVPPRIKTWFIWEMRLKELEESVKRYGSETSKGQSAKTFGENIKEIWRLSKELEKK